MPFGVPYQDVTFDMMVLNPHLLEQFASPPLVVLNPHVLQQFAEAPLSNAHLLGELTRPSLVVLRPCSQAQLERPTEPAKQQASRAERTFSWLASLIPRRVWQEEIGDALEAIAAMVKADASMFQIMLKVGSMIFVALFNGLREMIAAHTGRK
jgi:hypothetical protein